MLRKKLTLSRQNKNVGEKKHVSKVDSEFN